MELDPRRARDRRHLGSSEFPLGRNAPLRHRRGRQRLTDAALLARGLAGPELCGRAQARQGQLQETAALAPAALRFEEGVHLARGGYRALVLVGLVVPFDVLELVAIVAHEPVRLAQALGRDVALPVDAIEARAVAEVEAGHR